MSKLLLLLALLSPLTACDRESAPSASASAPSAPGAPGANEQPVAALPAGMSRVSDVSQVCMVNDQFMGRPQIPVDVEGRTYFGCCAMCKDKLTLQPETRTARDPVTGQEVDKAKAVIVQDAQGKVLYFASEDTLRKFATKG